MPLFGFSRASLRRKRRNSDTPTKDVKYNNNNNLIINDINNADDSINQRSHSNSRRNSSSTENKQTEKKISKDEKLKILGKKISREEKPKNSEKKHSKEEKSKFSGKKLSKEEKHKTFEKKLSKEEKSRLFGKKTSKEEKQKLQDLKSNIDEENDIENKEVESFSVENICDDITQNDDDNIVDEEDIQVQQLPLKLKTIPIPDRDVKESPSLDKRAVRRRRKKPCIAIHRRSQHFEENPPAVINHRKSRNFEEEIESSKKDPLKRFEYLRNGKATSVMIRATPNAVRWDEINRIQYRFQALNFHSDVLEALIHNSPPLSRREHKAVTKTTDDDTTDGSSIRNDSNNNNIHQSDTRNCSTSSDDDESNKLDNFSSTTNDDIDTDKNKKKSTPPRQQRTSPHQQHQGIVTCVHRSNSFERLKKDLDDSFVKRKSSVVQLTKDDTSDYNSDEEVFQNRSENDSFDSVRYNATICHVTTGHIQDTTRIQVTSFSNDDSDLEDNNNNSNNSHRSKQPTPSGSFDNASNCSNNDINRTDLSRLKTRETYNSDDESTTCNGDRKRFVSSAPPSTKVSVVSPIDQLSMNDRFHSEILNTDIDIDSEDLNSKTKDELVDLVKRLKRELETTKHYSLQQNHSKSSTLLDVQLQPRTRTRTSAPLLCSGTNETRRLTSGQESIDEEEKDDLAALMKCSDGDSCPGVHSLIQDFENRKSNE